MQKKKTTKRFRKFSAYPYCKTEKVYSGGNIEGVAGQHLPNSGLGSGPPPQLHRSGLPPWAQAAGPPSWWAWKTEHQAKEDHSQALKSNGICPASFLTCWDTASVPPLFFPDYSFLEWEYLSYTHSSIIFW